MAISNKPYEIIAFPYTLYLGPGGTAMPTLAEIATAEEKYEKGEVGALTGFKRIGTSGALNYGEGGVTATHSQTLQFFTGSGATMPRKSWRTDEAIEIALELADLSAKQYAYILDNATITTVAGVTGSAEKPGEEHFSLYKGPLVYNYAALLVGISPMNANYKAAYYMPACYQSANPAPKYTLKGGPALLALQFVSIIEEQGKYPEWHGQIEP
jgi:hypothetical protein